MSCISLKPYHHNQKHKKLLLQNNLHVVLSSCCMGASLELQQQLIWGYKRLSGRSYLLSLFGNCSLLPSPRVVGFRKCAATSVGHEGPVRTRLYKSRVSPRGFLRPKSLLGPIHSPGTPKRFSQPTRALRHWAVLSGSADSSCQT